MDDNIALVVADLTKATKLKMPAMVVMVHQMRDIYDRIEALTTQLAEARESERAAVVAWLRDNAMSERWRTLSDAIEAKEHLT